jgi:hypothetical protein
MILLIIAKVLKPKTVNDANTTKNHRMWGIASWSVSTNRREKEILHESFMHDNRDIITEKMMGFVTRGIFFISWYGGIWLLALMIFCTNLLLWLGQIRASEAFLCQFYEYFIRRGGRQFCKELKLHPSSGRFLSSMSPLLDLALFQNSLCSLWLICLTWLVRGGGPWLELWF